MTADSASRAGDRSDPGYRDEAPRNDAPSSDEKRLARSNLPAQTTSFVGREQETLTVVLRVRLPHVRLLTLTGPGGIGKTRLAIEAASQLRVEFPDGVFFVPLAPLREPEAALLAIAAAINLKVSGDHPVLDELKKRLGEKELLLVLDNSEQVVAAVLIVNALLTSCPRLKILATSRAALNIRGEHQFEVPALGLPLRAHAGSPISLAEVERCGAVQLFVERSQAARGDFSLSEDNAADIAEICLRLEGIPLAIELAAARARLFTPQAMLARLESRLKLLGGGPEDLPERQRTMRNTIAWSYELLDAEEQRLFQRLSAFPGGCTLDALETIWAGDQNIAILDGVDSLVRKSLVRTEEKAGAVRFIMLETIREYGLEMLELSGDRNETFQRCLAFFACLVAGAEPELAGPRQAQWMAQLESEHVNLRFAIQLGLGSAQAGTSLQIAGAMWRFWANRGHLTEGRRWLESCLKATEDADTPVRAGALRGAGSLAWRQSDFGSAQQLLELSLAMSRRLGDPHGVAAALNNLGGVALHQGNRKLAREMGEEALALYRSLGDRPNLALLLINLGGMAGERGDFASAEVQLNEGLAISREIRDRWRVALALVNLGIVACRQKDYSRAQSYCEESLETSKETGNRFMIASALCQLGEVNIHRADLAVAASCLEEALTIFVEMGSKRGMAQSLDRIAALAAARGNSHKAALLLGAADALRETMHIVRAPSEQILYRDTASRMQQRLGKELYAAESAEGRGWSIERAVSEALRTRQPDPPAGTGFHPPRETPEAPLTPREMEVVRLVAQGLTNAEIAERLVISPRTAETHVNHVLNRLGFNSRVQVAAWAIQKGLGMASEG